MLLDTLASWNRWGRAIFSAGFKRNVTDRITPFLTTKEIIALIGPRRAGKTTVLFQLMDRLETQGVKAEAMLHVNFEDPAFAPELQLKLLDQIYDIYRQEIFPKGKAFLFFDEIQNVPQWERWVRVKNEKENIKIFITGSSSNLMSRELGTLLTGRHATFKIFPLSFKEFLGFKSISAPQKLLPVSPLLEIQQALNDYLKWGGFPEIVLANDEFRKEFLLKQYFDDVLFKDVMMRHRIRDSVTLRNLAVHLVTHTGSLISLQRIAKIFGVSLDLARSYCQFLQEAFLIDFAPFYSRKIAERNRNPQKIYTLDLGLCNAVSLANTADRGHIIETAIFQELLRRVNDGIFYWKGTQEIDLVLRRGNIITTLIQVLAEGLERKEVQERELKVFTEAKKIFPKADNLLIIEKLPKTIINYPTIKILPLWYFLLGDKT